MFLIFFVLVFVVRSTNSELNNRILMVGGETLFTESRNSVLSEWSDEWFVGLRSLLVVDQWYVQVNSSIDMFSLEDAVGHSLSLYFPHNGHLLVSTQVSIDFVLKHMLLWFDF